MESNIRLSVSLAFREVKLPPVQDVLIIGVDSIYGLHGISESINIVEPDRFQLITLNDPIVAAIMVSKKVLAKISKDALIRLLELRVFPFVVSDELTRVDLDYSFSYENIELEL